MTEDIIEATIKATAEYVDMCEYWFRLMALREEFDRSIERCEPSAWIKINMTGETEADDIEDARFNLEGAGESFHNLTCRAEQKCSALWKLVLSSSKEEVKKYFFGEFIEAEKDFTEELLEHNLFTLVNNIEYDGVMEHSVERFAEELKKLLLRDKEESTPRKVDNSKAEIKSGVTIDFAEYKARLNS
jgi:hypothetical protein